MTAPATKLSPSEYEAVSPGGGVLRHAGERGGAPVAADCRGVSSDWMGGMSAPAFTPGPWRAVATPRPHGIADVNLPPWREVIAEGMVIGEIYGDDEDDGEPDNAAADANARLIAAAPDYAAAAEMLLKWFDHSGASIKARWSAIPAEERAAIVGAFRAARAKARGEQ